MSQLPTISAGMAIEEYPSELYEGKEHQVGICESDW